MVLESVVEPEAESVEFQINEPDKKRVTRLMEHFREEALQKDGVAGVYHSLFLLHTAIALRVINSETYAGYQAVLSGKIPFHMQKGRVLSREYSFANCRKGYKTRIKFSSSNKAFDPLSVGGIVD